jgi:ribosomal protein S18 acetylase RimI-like enzyme
MHNIDIKVRDAQLSDHKTILDFQMAMALETEELTLDQDTLSKGIMAVLKDSSKARYYIADSGGKAAGMLMITTEWSDWRNRWVWWIQSVYTSPEFRKMGVYKILYQHIKSIVHNSEDIGGIRLYVDKRNVKAQMVYQGLGMNGEHYATFEWMKENE